MDLERFAKRRRKLIRSLKQQGVDALMVTNFTNVTYLTGFSGDDSYLLIGPQQTILISDSRYTIQIGEECSDIDTHFRSNRVPIMEAAGKLLRRAKPSKLAVESNSLTVGELEELSKQVKSLEIVPLSGLVETLREIKDSTEIASIREAVRMAEQGFAVIRASLVGRMSELEAAHELEHSMRKFGATRAGFEPIVAVGARAALPHAQPSKVTMETDDFVLFDWGAETADGYRSDLTRVLVTGKISTKLEKIYRVVLKAQLRGIKAIRPGAKGCDVDKAARSVIEKAGYGKQFGHGLGHGIGLEIHEGGRFSPTSETVLKAGMVMTVEPGIYIPGWGGVRIEDDILVTRDGHEVLTSVPKEFEQAIVR
jgi:Xaa-Pro aminopeptidase